MFLDLWDEFKGKEGLYRQDGIHLNWQGTQALSQAYEHALNTFQGN